MIVDPVCQVGVHNMQRKESEMKTNCKFYLLKHPLYVFRYYFLDSLVHSFIHLFIFHKCMINEAIDFICYRSFITILIMSCLLPLHLYIHSILLTKKFTSFYVYIVHKMYCVKIMGGVNTEFYIIVVIRPTHDIMLLKYFYEINFIALSLHNNYIMESLKFYWTLGH